MLISKDALRTLHRALEAWSCSSPRQHSLLMVPFDSHAQLQKKTVYQLVLFGSRLAGERKSKQLFSLERHLHVAVETNKPVAKKAWNDVMPVIASGNASGLLEISNQLKSCERKKKHTKKT